MLVGVPPCAEFLMPVMCPLPPGKVESPGSIILISLIDPFLNSANSLSTFTPLPEPVIVYVTSVLSSPACV